MELEDQISFNSHLLPWENGWIGRDIQPADLLGPSGKQPVPGGVDLEPLVFLERLGAFNPPERVVKMLICCPLHAPPPLKSKTPRYEHGQNLCASSRGARRH